MNRFTKQTRVNKNILFGLGAGVLLGGMATLAAQKAIKHVATKTAHTKDPNNKKSIFKRPRLTKVDPTFLHHDTDTKEENKFKIELSSIDKIDRAIETANDIIANRIDMMKHKDELGSRERMLAWMLRNVDLEGLQKAHIICDNLSNSLNTFCAIDPNLEDMIDDMYAFEAAHNIARFNPAYHVRPITYENDIVSLSKPLWPQQQNITVQLAELDEVYPQIQEHDKKDQGEWATRKTIATYLELCRSMLRLDVNFNISTDARICYMSVLGFKPEVFKYLYDTPVKQKSYAVTKNIEQLFMAIACGFMATSVTKIIAKLYIGNKNDSYITASITRQEFDQLDLDNPQNLLNAQCVTYQLDDEGFYICLSNGELFERDYFTSIDDIHPVQLEELPQAIKDVCYASTSDDLRIHREDLLIYAWSKLKPFISQAQSISEVVSKLMEYKKIYCFDNLVTNACDTLAKELINGSLTVNDNCEDVFMLARSDAKLLDLYKRLKTNSLDSLSDLSREAAMEHFDLLTETRDYLLHIIKSKRYADSDEIVWRWFESPAARIAYNRQYKSKAQVRLVPGSYFSALMTVCDIYLALNSSDDLNLLIEELTRIAPTSIQVCFVASNYYQKNSQLYKALEGPKNLLKYTLDEKGMRMLCYRNAYLHWKLGQYDIAAVLYLKVMMGPQGRFRDHAVNEFQEMLQEATAQLGEILSDNKLVWSESIAILKKYGYQMIADTEGNALITKASVLAMDHHLYNLAAGFTMHLNSYEADESDILKHVVHSILPYQMTAGRRP